MKSYLSIAFTLLAVVAACGDDGGGTDSPDASRADGRDVPDAGSPDAAPQMLALRLQVSSLALEEGSTAAVSVSLSDAPAAPITVRVVASAPDVVAAREQTLIFEPRTWNQPQTLTIAAVADVDTDDERGQIRVEADGVAPATLEVAVTDTTLPRIEVSATRLAVVEGGTASLTLMLSARPSQDVVVRGVITEPMHASVDATPIRFTPDDWNLPRELLITAPQDDDVRSATTALRVTGDGVRGVTVLIDVADDDRLGVVLSSDQLSVVEGASARFTVRLTQRAETSLTVRTTDCGVATASPSTLRFTNSNWDQPQVVTVTAVEDVDAADNTVGVDVTFSNGEAQTVRVAVTDNDTQRLVLSRTTATVIEGGATNVQLRLAARPLSPVVVAVASSDEATVRVSPTSVTFGPDDWNVARSLTLEGVVDTDAIEEDAVIRLSATGLESATIAVHVDDRDIVAITAPDLVTVDEGASTDIEVALTRAPRAAVVVRVESAIPGLVAVAPATLTFDRDTWNVAQRVRATAAFDGNLTDDSSAVTLRADGLATKVARILVNDTRGPRIALSTETVTLAEGAISTVTVALVDRPTTSLVVAATSRDTTVAMVTPTHLAFTPTNYDQPQTLTVVSVPDADTTTDTTTIDLAVGGAAQASIAVVVNDDVARAILTSVTRVTMTEGGGADVDVSLSAPPTTQVVVRAVPADATRIVPQPNGLLFTRANYSVPQRIRLRAAQDIDAGDATTEVTFEALDYPTARVEAVITDDDAQEVRATIGLLRVLEGSTREVVVVLGRPPGGSAIVTVSSADPAVATVSPALLTFTDSNWNTPQVVILAGTRDGNTTNNRTELRFVTDRAPTLVREVEVVDAP